ncbi:MAG: SHOCT domain-containing protein [Epsilonproteobacteria bacterium]|nr:SHOCT domain-containing protein [Campylobacterota bacterium]
MLKKLFGVSVALLGLILLGGCSNNPSIITNNTPKQQFHQLDVYQDFSHPEVGQNERRHVASESISKWTSVKESRKVAMRKAEAYCAKTNGKMIVMKEHIANLPYLINHYPRVELSFVCHDINEKVAHVSKKSMPVYHEAPKTTVIKEKYKNLVFLKKLLDDGTLTQKEFDSEKKKLLEEK